MPADGMSAATRNRTSARPAGSSRTISMSVGTEYMGGEAVERGAPPIPYNLTTGPMSPFVKGFG
jgi:hypothetical protein